MAMSITQDTFDEVVKENMEDFGMDRKGAAEDAVEQFKAQGTVGTTKSIGRSSSGTCTGSPKSQLEGTAHEAVSFEGTGERLGSATNCEVLYARHLTTWAPRDWRFELPT